MSGLQNITEKFGLQPNFILEEKTKSFIPIQTII